MKNKLSDLNEHLFAQLERLSDEDKKGDELKEEISRAKAVTGIASQIIANGQLVLGAIRFKEQFFSQDTKLPEIFPDTAKQLGEGKKTIPQNIRDRLE